MDLKGAKIRNIHKVCAKIEDEYEKPLSINVPFYQRPFSWESEQIEKLISDYHQYVETDTRNLENNNYFAGSIVTVIKKDEEYHDLIDGQQRITILFLTNYIIFLLLRAYISQLILHRKTTRLDSALANMEQVINYLLKKSNVSELHNIRNIITNKLEEGESPEMDEEDTEDIYDKTLRIFHKITYLPEPEIMQDSENYDYEYMNNLNNLFDLHTLSLKYSRDVFNKDLKTVLKHVKINLTNQSGPELEIINNESLSKEKHLEQYKIAIEKIYKDFKIYVLSKTQRQIQSLSQAYYIINHMSNFLKNIEFCIIQTGNTNDAYTLFEVLNDRSLTLNDLDLIKNLFYKHFCQNTNDNEANINNKIEKLEELWNGCIFKPSDPEYYKKLISFFSTVYLTANTEIDYNERQKYRNNIETYLTQTYNVYDNKEYKFNDIYDEFRLMLLIRIILEKTNIQKNNRVYNSLQAETNSTSIVNRALHLLNGKKQYKIMSALISLILQTYFQEYSKIDEINFKKFIDEIKNNEYPSNEKQDHLYDASSKIWRMTILAHDYKLPLQYARSLIIHNHYKSDLTKVDLPADLLDKAKNQFIEWSNNWQKNINDDFKIKILFLNLLKVGKSNNILFRSNAEKRFNSPAQIQLDHIEPNQIDSHQLNSYFMPSNPEERSRHVNQLGNFILMDAYYNTKKSNTPAYNIFYYLEQSGLGENSWWLSTELREHLNSYSDENNVPTEQFFLERKSLLRKYFYTLLSYDYNYKNFYLLNLN